MSEQVSSPNTATGNTQYFSLEHQWNLPDRLPARLESEYGYVSGGRPFVSTRDELIALVQRGQPLTFVGRPTVLNRYTRRLFRSCSTLCVRINGGRVETLFWGPPGSLSLRSLLR
jgi:hypothetical protein